MNLDLDQSYSISFSFQRDIHVSNIQGYEVIPFNELHSDAACVSRIIEIFTLNKLRSEGEQLTSITGLNIPDTAATAEEINLLLSRCSKLCSIEEKELGVRQGAIHETKLAIQQATGE